MLVTEPFEIHGTHSGVKYTLQETTWLSEVTQKMQPRLILWTWYDLTKEYIFEETVKSEEHAFKRIDELKRDGFLKENI